MGSLYRYSCSTCDYQAEICGGKDRGMLAAVQTMTCQDCSNLVDVSLGSPERGGPIGDDEFDKSIGICPRCKSKNVLEWTESKPCPKCDGTMIRGEHTAMWD